MPTIMAAIIQRGWYIFDRICCRATLACAWLITLQHADWKARRLSTYANEEVIPIL